ncbi:MAG: DUF2341 domain-containing protein [Deltaproteobacteria bacterium]|nr:DUF2341 domain-containing protein [Deltaproteobacteria bacterium]
MTDGWSRDGLALHDATAGARDGARGDGAAGDGAGTDGSPYGGTAWWDARHPYRKLLTVPAGAVTADLLDFPVLVSLAGDPDLRAQVTGPNDLRFVSVDGAVVYEHEVESWSASSGALVAWVKLPRLASATGARFYLYFGRAAAPAPPAGRSVWSAYRLVYHLADPMGGAVRNAASEIFDGTATGTVSVVGRVGSARRFTSLADGVSVAGASALVSGAPRFSLSFWLFPDYATDGAVSPAMEPRVFEQLGPWTAGRLIRFGSTPPGWFLLQVDLELVGGTEYAQVPVRRAGWTHVALVFDGNTVRTYSDGQLANTYAAAGKQVPVARDEHLTLGHTTFGRPSFIGSLDEFRLTLDARSSAWLSAERANASAPQTFVTVGALEQK